MSGDGGATARVLTVRAGSGRFGIPLECVREIVRDLRLVPLAGAPDRVLGLAGFRGEPLAVIALAALAGDDTSLGSAVPVVVVDLGDEGSVGLAVDRVAGVQRVARDSGQRLRGPFVAANADDGPVAVLDVDRVRSNRRVGEA